MKIAITSTGQDLNSTVDARFGRCQYFIIYDTQTKDFQAIANEALSSGSGAGVQAAQTIKNNGVQVVLTGNVGPNAMTTLSAAKIGVAVGVMGTVKEAIEKYSTGEYKLADQANVSAHFGFKEE
ncbi:MAG: NifB/NifX family molybdenum-iron cluster-binding protein [Spirochaetes bacterium]|nr:NifB/NifX family molybdenum-iron cluster-binding protein [Spirochaetota bacterium]